MVKYLLSFRCFRLFKKIVLTQFLLLFIGGNYGVVYAQHSSLNMPKALFVINTAPVAVDDLYSTNEDVPLSIPALGVLSNDSDVDNDPLTVSVLNGPVNGQLILNADGSFIYTPTTDFNGSDSFTYIVSDDHSGTDVGSVSLTITAINDPPTGVPDSFETAQNQELVIHPNNGVLANDTDVDSIAMHAQIITEPVHGTISFSLNGSFTYTPSINYIGLDYFTYQAFDGQDYSEDTLVTINVLPGIPVTGEYLVFIPLILK